MSNFSKLFFSVHNAGIRLVIKTLQKLYTPFIQSFKSLKENQLRLGFIFLYVDRKFE